jgi:hypothetical protein
MMFSQEILFPGSLLQHSAIIQQARGRGAGKRGFHGRENS